MALLATYLQQPNDRLDYDIPCELSTGDSIASATVEITPATGLTVNPVIVGSTVKLWVDDGATVGTYLVEVLIETSIGRKKEVEVKFKIKDL